MLRKIWKDPVWSAVIATGIIAILSSASSIFIFGWTKTVGFVFWLKTWLTSNSNIPNYSIVFGGLTALAVVISTISKLHKYCFPKDEYTKDVFFDVVWRWHYGPAGEIYNLKSYCPKCDYEIQPVNIGPYAIVKHYALVCDICKVKFHEYNADFDMSSIEDHIIRLIEKNIRKRSKK